MVSTQYSESSDPSSNLGGPSMCNDRELSCFKRVETCSKPPKHVFFALLNLPLSSPDTNSENQLEYHRNTIFMNLTVY